MMNSDVCREFFYHLNLDRSLDVGSSPEAVVDWLKKIELPRGLKHLLMHSWPQSSGFVAGRVHVHSALSLTSNDLTNEILKHRLLNIGSAPNGDFLVIDLTTDNCVPGFISHSEWSPYYSEPGNPRDFLQPIARSFDSFLYRLVEERYLPTDYYAAKAHNQFLREEERDSQ